jgi:hypothetical protein
MPKELTIELSDDQLASINSYIAANIEWQYDDTIKANAPKRRWATADDYLRESLAKVLEGPMAQFPSAAVKAKMSQLSALQKEIAAVSNPTVRTI